MSKKLNRIALSCLVALGCLHGVSLAADGDLVEVKQPIKTRGSFLTFSNQYKKYLVENEKGKKELRFTNDMLINPNGTQENLIFEKDEKSNHRTINAEGHTLTFHTRGSNSINHGEDKATIGTRTLHIIAKKWIIDVEDTNNNNLYNTAITDQNSTKYTIDADTEMYVKSDLTKKNGNQRPIRNGIFLAHGSQIDFNGNLKIEMLSTPTAIEEKRDLEHYYANGIYTGFKEEFPEDSRVTVKGDVDLHINGTGMQANENATIEVKGGGKIEIEKRDDAEHYAIMTEEVIFHMNAIYGKDNVLTSAGNRDVNIKGNLGVLNKNYGSARNPGENPSLINVSLSTKTSTFEGVAFNEFDELGDNKVHSAINIALQNGATWKNQSYGAVRDGVELYNRLKGSSIERDKAYSFTGSKVGKFIGGADSDSKGIIEQKDSNPLRIEDYSGTTLVRYEVDKKSRAASNYRGGALIINKANPGASVITEGVNPDVDATDVKAVENELAELAPKAMYLAAEEAPKHLSSKVQLAKSAEDANPILGFTTWGEDGRAPYVQGSLLTARDAAAPETSVVKSVRSATTLSSLLWRDLDLQKFARLHNERAQEKELGVWGHIFTGKSKLDMDSIAGDMSYKGVEVGFDTKLGERWLGGLSLAYVDGEGKYMFNGKGDEVIKQMAYIQATKQIRVSK